MDFAVKTGLYLENFDKCRCCLKNQGVSDISKEYRFVSDEKIVHETILKDTFNIQLATYNFIGKKVCNACITRIRDALDFRNQLLHAEATLATKWEQLNVIGFDPKEEVDSDLEYEYQTPSIHEDSIENNSESKKYATILEKEVVIKLEPLHQISQDKTKRASNITKNKKKLIHPKSDGVNVKKRSRNKETNEKILAMRFNTIQLVMNSNMIIFTSKRSKYACYYCRKSYLDIKMLRQHYQEHSIDKFIRDNLNRCKGLSFKNVDISNLICKKCSSYCNNIIELQDHLTTHGLVFKSTDNLLVAYKLEEGFSCLVCKAEFKTFNRLSIHMHSHSTRNICEVCGEAYVNRISLRSHINNQHREHNCSICLQAFPNKSAVLKHQKNAHNKKSVYKRYCLQCDKKFKYTHQLKEHMIESHGVKREIAECEFCGKTFTPVNLKVHIRSVHIGERNHPCGSCDKRFFTLYDRQRHERSHIDEKAFACEFCEARFKTKDSVRRHLRSLHSKCSK